MSVRSVSPDSRFVSVASMQCDSKLWEVANGKEGFKVTPKSVMELTGRSGLWWLFPECPEYRNQGRGDCIQGRDVQGVECGCTLQVQRGPKVQVQKHDVMRLTLECWAAWDTLTCILLF
jgi:hypothetical protein